jgi:ABC-type dipeptide/oligopeptide/nickel transport system permease component
MGFHWFITYDVTDTGLLQGNLGRSMENQRPVNELLGDRLMLTVLMSLGTILLTWALAIPIGIYSAVRQYSLSDYVLTLIGFVGMCVPAFLLALVLMAASGVTGLFSPEFAARPEWSWPKVIDLLKHLWIPIVVLGVGGTAGMIRVMRANLLDELRRPYVITAMAKGVRPLKLLLKYPVRMSLNPFISGIGGLFPQLISGGAIVSVVLSLPTIGPLMLDALRTQDMYLAGSLLMLLNVLSVLGTLVSDLLLLWLDPRIRFVGGSR